MAHFQNTCNPRSVKPTGVVGSSPGAKQGKRTTWEFVGFWSKSGNPTKECKLKVRQTIFEGEEEYEVLFYRGKDGTIYVLDNLDPALFGL